MYPLSKASLFLKIYADNMFKYSISLNHVRLKVSRCLALIYGLDCELLRPVMTFPFCRTITFPCSPGSTSRGKKLSFFFFLSKQNEQTYTDWNSIEGNDALKDCDLLLTFHLETTKKKNQNKTKQKNY